MMVSVTVSLFTQPDHSEEGFEKMNKILRRNRGITLIELLVAIVLSSLVIAGLYRTFLGQQRTYYVQEQVVDMRQNMRVVVSNMVKELRMAGFGAVSGLGSVTINGTTYSSVVNRNIPATPTGSVTILTALTSAADSAGLVQATTAYQIVVDRLKDDQDPPVDIFDLANRKYISIGGVESNEVTSIITGSKTLVLKNRVMYSHPANTRVYPIRAISYDTSGRRNTNLGGGFQPLAGNIENVQFEYLDADGNPAADNASIQMIRVVITARTDQKDSGLKGDGFLRRQITSNVQLRNLGVVP
jgi:prepilin-type N-terminal cleavage/methylation domain-containing protein